MSHSQLHPLQLNPSTNEPYLRLPAPHDNIIITPPRMTDAPSIPPIHNDPRVYTTLIGPPYPYLVVHAEQWLAESKKATDEVLADLQNTDAGHSSLRIVGACPVRIIREVRADGTDTFLGDIGIHRCRYFEVPDPDRKEHLLKENEARALGDPDTFWEFGDYLAPSHHGRGIMSAALRTVLENWAIPRMGVRRLHVTVFEGNVASVKVFQKNGFRLVGTVDDCCQIQESKGGGKIGLHVLDWSFDAT